MSQRTPAVTVVQTRRDLTALAKKLRGVSSFVIDVETTSRIALEAELTGIALCFSDSEGYYIPLAGTQRAAIDNDAVIVALAPLLTDVSITKILYDAKFCLSLLQSRYGISVSPIWDTLLAGYLLRKGVIEQHLDFASLVRQELHIEIPGDSPVPHRTTAENDGLSDQETAKRQVARACALWQLRPVLEKKLVSEKLRTVFESMELPLIPILADMELRGIKVDSRILRTMSATLEKSLTALSGAILKLAGTTCNINSPKQLADVLFVTLKIPTRGIKKTKTGFSTASSELEKIDHPIAAKIMEYRELGKLKSTYVDALPALINPKTKRVHTSFNQAITATGRLSSSNPNLQNIPIRTDIGRSIRKAFVADRGNILTSADYSQIELRILAHLCEDETLIAAFRDAVDIHAKTASIVENVPLSAVTPEMRRAAKVVNFGILYGLGPRRLAHETGFTLEEAQKFIDAYFNGYPRVKQWIEETKKHAYAFGFSETLFGRRRYIPELSSADGYLRAFGERMAVNMPTQGTAADIMKLAMIGVYEQLQKHTLNTSIILQVHDELVLEGPAAESKKVNEILTRTMQAVVKLHVPLTVNISHGKNWKDLG